MTLYIIDGIFTAVPNGTPVNFDITVNLPTTITAVFQMLNSLLSVGGVVKVTFTQTV